MNSLAVHAGLSSQALSALEAVVGAEHVHVDMKTRRAVAMATEPQKTLSAAVVYPASADEVRAVIRVAAEHGLKVWPFSGGNNWGYGTRNAPQDGAVILMLSRMNRIIEVNESLCYAVIEPGVTQGQLSGYLRKKGLKLWVDVNDATPKASIIGNALERGYGVTTHGDHFAQLCGLEVVLPNADLIRTGGPLADQHTWATHKWGCGPYLEGIFSQSNMGIVVKAGVWLKPEPECFNMVVFSLDKEDSLPEAIDRLRVLGLHGMFNSNTHMTNDIGMLSVVSQYPREMLNGARCLSAEARRQLRQRYGFAPWTLAGAVYGTREQVECQKRAIKRALSPLGRVQFITPVMESLASRYIAFQDRIVLRHPLLARLIERVRRLIIPESLEVLRTIPGEFFLHAGVPTECITKMAYFKSQRQIPAQDLDPARDGGGVICHAPAVPATGEHSRRILEIVKPLFQKHEFDPFLCFTRMNERTNFLLTLIYFDPLNAEESQRAARLYAELAAATDQAGYQVYRSGVMHYGSLMQSSPALSRFLNTVKRAVDPDDLLAPGKYGIGGLEITTHD